MKKIGVFGNLDTSVYCYDPHDIERDHLKHLKIPLKYLSYSCLAEFFIFTCIVFLLLLFLFSSSSCRTHSNIPLFKDQELIFGEEVQMTFY